MRRYTFVIRKLTLIEVRNACNEDINYRKADYDMILVTGFAPFEGAKINPSYEAIKGLKKIHEVRDQIEILELPVVFGKAPDLLLEKIREYKPSAVISVGLAGGRKEITPELIAVNFRNARISDNEGNKPDYEQIIPDGPAGIFSRLPLQEMIQQMKENGYPASLSTTAGSYVCNEVMYRLLYDYNGTAGYIHVPTSEELGGNMSVSEMTAALAICIKTIC